MTIEKYGTIGFSLTQFGKRRKSMRDTEIRIREWGLSENTDRKRNDGAAVARL
jgi:hypothetical protein